MRSILAAAAAITSVSVLAGCAALPPLHLATTDPPPGATGPSPGCGVTTRGPVTEGTETIPVDGRTRTYTITVPPAHVAGTSTPIPLVFDFHGLLEGTVRTHPFATQFSAEAKAQGFAVVSPIGTDDGLLWDVSLQENNPDLRFIDALVARFEDTMCIDRSRIYVTGLSYGAFMSSMLMCMRSNTFAAAAPVAGLQNLCTATERKIPFLTFHGTADPILPYPMFSAAPQAIASKYGCTGPPTATVLSPNPDPTTHGPITKYVWDCSAVGSAAESYVIGGGGHSWPGSLFFQWVAAIVGPTATSIDATQIIWDFFALHHL
jgi:polyhydroxybutyrate depolymerase